MARRVTRLYCEPTSGKRHADIANKETPPCFKGKVFVLGDLYSPTPVNEDINQIIEELAYETNNMLVATIHFTVFTSTLGEVEFSVMNSERGINILLRRANQMAANVLCSHQKNMMDSLAQQFGKPVNFDIAVHLM